MLITTIINSEYLFANILNRFKIMMNTECQ